ncbi:hypothetical protein [Acutalibacter muris]|uniref:hypothetical protein n=1 Tax=Acutalibacter muris TaxID=1796620 RepID=UPI001C3EF01B|nr:hypothetical protein [Acutalibacter muris]
MGDIYFPSCNFNKATPETAKLLLERMKAIMPVAGCCRVDKLECPKGDRALYLCQACREVIEVRFPELVPENLLVWLDREEKFPLPDYSGLAVSIQDCWRDREHPEIHEAVRSLLKKMGVSFRDIPENRELADYCGDLHFQPNQAAKHGGKLVLCYCNRCRLCIEEDGGRAVHLMELVMGTYSREGEYGNRG